MDIFWSTINNERCMYLENDIVYHYLIIITIAIINRWLTHSQKIIMFLFFVYRWRDLPVISEMIMMKCYLVSWRKKQKLRFEVNRRGSFGWFKFHPKCGIMHRPMHHVMAKMGAVKFILINLFLLWNDCSMNGKN